MKKISPRLLSLPLLVALADEFHELSVGKVRHTYEVKNFPNYLLVVATNRISIFDFVLNALVDFKGEVLTALTIDWLRRVLADVPHHLVAYGSGVDEFLPVKLRGKAVLQSRAIVVKKLRMLPVEFVIRGYLMGSGLKSYQATGMVCGLQLPAGLAAGSELPEPIFTPTTKSETGHDEAVTFSQMAAILRAWLNESGIDRDAGDLSEETRELALSLYKRAKKSARERGIHLLDTKFEFGLDENGRLTVADEVVTPDSSRFSLKEDYLFALASGTVPATRDKQYVRDKGTKVRTPFFTPAGNPIFGLDQLNPDNPQHADFVCDLRWPDGIMKKTAEIYLDIAWRLTGVELSVFQRDVMRIDA